MNPKETVKESTTEQEMVIKTSVRTQADALQAMSGVGNYGVAGKKKRFPWKAILIVLVSIVVLGAAAFVAWEMLKSKYTDAIDEQIALLNDRNKDLSACLDGSCGGMKRDFVMEYGKVLEEVGGKDNHWESNMENLYASQYESLEKSFGSNFEVSYEVQEEKQLSQDELKTYFEDIGDYLSTNIQEAGDNEELKSTYKEKLTNFYYDWREKFRQAEVTDGYSAIVKFKYNNGGGANEVTRRMVVVQIDGEWIVRVGGLMTLDSGKIFENMSYK